MELEHKKPRKRPLTFAEKARKHMRAQNRRRLRFEMRERQKPLIKKTKQVKLNGN